MAYRLGVDVGGTFTDLFLVSDGDGGAQHRHQFDLLVLEIGRKQRPCLGRDLEQPVVEEIGGRAGDRHHFLEARLDQVDLPPCHRVSRG